MNNRAPLYAVPAAANPPHGPGPDLDDRGAKHAAGTESRRESSLGGVPAPARKRGRPRDPQADIRILEAASELMLEHGFENMTVDEVAATARVGKATVYRRWARKEDLALAALQQLYRNQMPYADTGALRTDLKAAYSAIVTFASTSSGTRHLRTAVAESIHDPRVRELYREALATAEEATRECLRRALLRGEIRRDVPLEYASQWLISLLTARTVAGRELPTLVDVDDLVAFVMQGVRAN